MSTTIPQADYAALSLAAHKLRGILQGTPHDKLVASMFGEVSPALAASNAVVVELRRELRAHGYAGIEFNDGSVLPL